MILDWLQPILIREKEKHISVSNTIHPPYFAFLTSWLTSFYIVCPLKNCCNCYYFHLFCLLMFLYEYWFRDHDCVLESPEYSVHLLKIVDFPPSDVCILHLSIFIFEPPELFFIIQACFQWSLSPFFWCFWRMDLVQTIVGGSVFFFSFNTFNAGFHSLLAVELLLISLMLGVLNSFSFHFLLLLLGRSFHGPWPSEFDYYSLILVETYCLLVTFLFL